MTVTVRDIRAAGLQMGRGLLCVTGIKQRMESEGFDWEELVRNGASEERMLQLHDPLADKAVEVAKEREDGR